MDGARLWLSRTTDSAMFRVQFSESSAKKFLAWLQQITDVLSNVLDCTRLWAQPNHEKIPEYITNAKMRALCSQVNSSLMRKAAKKESNRILFAFITMTAFASIISGLWDFYVTNAILTGWCVARMNTYNTSLLLAWLVCLCDLVYIIDGFARTSRRVNHSILTLNFSLLIGDVTVSTLLRLVLYPLRVFSFVPYHCLVMLDVEHSGLYLVICALRFLKILMCGRLYFLFTICIKINSSDQELHAADNSYRADLCANLQTDEGDQLSQEKNNEDWNWDHMKNLWKVLIFKICK